MMAAHSAALKAEPMDDSLVETMVVSRAERKAEMKVWTWAALKVA
jgi:hypothetical protein